MSIEIIQGGGLPELAAFIGHAIAGMPPGEGQAHLGAFFANIVGNISQEQWDKLKAASQLPCECGDPDCKVAITAIMDAGDRARAQFAKFKGVEPDDEKGFTT